MSSEIAGSSGVDHEAGTRNALG